ncbi:MAG: hypothetical protein ACLQG5_08175 [Methanobacterium sp.]
MTLPIIIIIIILGITAVIWANSMLNQTVIGTWTANFTTSTANPETVNYITLPKGTTSVEVNYSNLTNTTNSTSYFQFITLDFIPVEGQTIDLGNNYTDLRTVPVNSTQGNLSLLSNDAESVAVLDVSANGTITITAFS